MPLKNELPLPGGRPSRVSLQDIADHIGVSKATVCRALNGRGRTSPETRKRVVDAAESMGYEPDPALAALTRYRWGDRVAARTRYSLALVSVDPLHAERSSKVGEEDSFKAGARKRAEELNLIFEKHMLADPRSASSLSRLLHARGTDGVVFQIGGPIFDWDFRWDLFTCVTIGFDGDGHRLNAVTSDWFSGLRMVVTKVRETGRYKRIGFLDFFRCNPSMDARIRAAMLLERDSFEELHGRQPTIHSYPPKSNTSGDIYGDCRDAFLRWFEKNRPDAIIDSNHFGYWWLKEAGVSMPDEVGVVTLNAHERTRPEIAGALHNRFRQGGLAVDLMFNLIQTNEKGLSNEPIRLTTPCLWYGGPSLA